MKESKTLFLVLGVLTFAIFISLSVVHAQSTTSKTSITQQIYKNEHDVTQAVGNDSSPNVQFSTNNQKNAWGVEAGTLFLGANRMGGDNAYMRQLPEGLRNAGLLQVSNQMMNYAFQEAPTVDIPTHYANLLLPKEFRGDFDNTAYAANPGCPGTDGNGAFNFYTGCPPTTANATDSLHVLRIDKLWGISFGISMIGFVMVLLYAGFMMIFRQKVGGQTIVNISMSLQNMVIGLLFALSSYALGGFFINLSKYLVLILDAFFKATFNDGSLQKPFWNPDGKWFSLFISGPFMLIGRVADLAGLVNIGSRWDWSIPNKNGPLNVQVPDFDAFMAKVSVNFAGMFITLIVVLILAFMLVYVGFKVFMTAFTTYAKMILDIVTAPVYFMICSLPGRQEGYMGWIRKMFKNSLVLPMMFIIVNLAMYVGTVQLPNQNDAFTGITGGAINIDANAQAGSNGQGGGVADFFLKAAGPQTIVSVVILMIAPASSEILDELLGAGGSKASQNASKAISSGLSGVPVVGGMFK